MTFARVRGLLIVVAMVAGVFVPATATTATASQSKPPSSFVATGYFHTARGPPHVAGGPQGQPFYSAGVDHVTASPDTDRVTDTCPYCQAVAPSTEPGRLGPARRSRRLRSWGFNTLGAWSDTSPARHPDALHGAAVDGQRATTGSPVLRLPCRSDASTLAPYATIPTSSATSPTANCTGARLACAAPSSTTTWPSQPARRAGPWPSVRRRPERLPVALAQRTSR